MEFFAFVLVLYVWLLANPVAAIIIYIIPSIIAVVRKSDSRGLLIIINILGGWFFILWIIVFIWSITGKQERSDRH